VCPQHYLGANRRNAVPKTAPKLENAPHWKLRIPKTNNVTLVPHHPKEESPPCNGTSPGFCSREHERGNRKASLIQHRHMQNCKVQS